MDEKIKKRLRRKMDEVMAEAMEEIFRGKGEAGSICLIGKDDIGVGLPIEWNSEKEKYRVFGAVRKTIRQVKPEWGIFGSESWMVEAPRDAEAAKELLESRIQPRNHPLRKECFILIAEWKDGSIMMSQTFGRNALGHPMEDGSNLRVEESMQVMQTAIFGDAFQEAT
jgi:hypothetical protein